MGLISRVSSRTYRSRKNKQKNPTTWDSSLESQVELTDHVKTNKKIQQHGTRTNQDRQEGLAPNHRKVLHSLGLDFYTNSRIVSEVAIIPTKRLSNQIAGFITHTMKRIQKGPVRGISIKLQEEERERRDNYVPDQSALCEPLELDDTTTEMLKAIDLKIEDAAL